MSNNNPVTITVTAETKEAAQRLRALALDLKANVTALGLMSDAGGSGGDALKHLRETSLLTREAFHGLQATTLLLGGERFPMLGEGIMAGRMAMMSMRSLAMLTGVALGELLIPLAALTVALLPTGVFAWRAYKAAQEEARSAALLHAQTLELEKSLLEQVAAAEKGKVGDPDTLEYVRKLLSIGTPDALHEAQKAMIDEGLTKPAVAAAIEIKKTEEKMQTELWSAMGKSGEMQKVKAEYDARVADLQKQSSTASKLLAPGQTADDLAEAKRIYDLRTSELQAQINAEDTRQVKETQLKQLAIDIANIQAEAGETDDKALTALKVRSEYMQRIGMLLDQQVLTEQEYEEMRVAGWKKYTDEIRKAKLEALDAVAKMEQLRQETERAAVEAKLKSIQTNPFLTQTEKADQSVPAIQDLMGKNVTAMNAQVDIYNTTKDDAAKAAALKQINELIQKQAELQTQLNTAQGQNSFVYQLESQLTAFRTAIGNTARDLANFAMSPFVGMRNGLASAIDTMIEKGTTLKQFFSTISISILRSMISAFSEMVANWIMSHVIMAGVAWAWHGLLSLLGIQQVAQHAAQQATIVTITGTGTATRVTIRTAEAGHDMAMTGVQVGTHAAGEGTKTGATFLGAIGRGIIRVGETIFHGIQVGIRVAAHLAGEILMTIVTLAQSAIRVGIILIETIAYLILAAIEAMAAMAGIPFVGPILAIAALGAIIAAGVGAMGGFDEGGYTGDGSRHQVAGVVHKGEFVFRASAVDRIGVDNLAALHRGDSPAVTGGGGGGGQAPQFHLHVWDKRPSPKEYLNSGEGQHHFVELGQKHKTQIGIPS